MLVWGLMLLRSKLFYCLRLPLQSKARGGDQNARLPTQSNSRGVFLHVTNSEDLNLYFFFKKDNFRPSKFVVLAKGTNLEHLNLYCLEKGQIQSILICPTLKKTNSNHQNLSFMPVGQI